MKIGIVSNLYPPFERGGAELVAARVAHELYRRGHEVFVVSSRPFSNLKSLNLELTEQHVGKVYRFFPLNLFHLSNAHLVPGFIRVFWHIFDTLGKHSSKIIRHVIKQEEPDIFLTHNLKGMGLRLSRTIQDEGVFQIHTLHDVQLSIPSGLLLVGQEKSFMNRSFLRKIYEMFVKQSMGNPNVVISPSAFLMDFYRKRDMFPRSKKRILPNPSPKIRRVTRVERQEGPVRLLYVGQLEKHKGIQMLLDTLDEAKFDYELHIAGDGILQKYIEGRASRDRRIRFHGFISLEHILQLMTDVDAVVIPSQCYENSPTVIYEAFLVGVPVVASKIGGIGELIQPGRNGLLFEPGNKDALMAALVEIVQKKDWFWHHTQTIRDHAEQFSIKKYVDKLEALFPAK